jgi:hypothetical protein
MTIFDLNDNHTVEVECFLNSNIYYIDNFYKNPDEILNFLEHHDPPLHRPGQHPAYKSLNGTHFFDMRHEIIVDEIENVSSYLSSICGKSLAYPTNVLLTNKTKFVPCRFNDYTNNFWFPHIDPGYNAIIYLNKDDEESGTNLYEEVIPDTLDQYGEHVVPWRSKDNWSVIKHLKPKFNRCVIFDGSRFNHGMNICNDMYFGDKYRLNQVFFFE